MFVKRLFLLYLVAMAACGVGSADQPRMLAIRTDSAGIEIVSTPRQPDRLATLRIDPDAVLRDSLGDPFLFNSVPGWTVAVLASGLVAVVSHQEAVVHLFSPQGEYSGSLGGRGGGPGEFQRPLSVMAHGDTIAVYDPQRLAIQRWIAAEGTLLPQVNVPEDLQGATMLQLRGTRTFLADGRIGGDSRITELRWSDGESSGVQFAHPAGAPIPLSCMPTRFRRPPVFTPRVYVARHEGFVAAAGTAEMSVQILRNGQLWRLVRRDLPVRKSTRALVRLETGDGVRGSINGQSCRVGPEELAEALGVLDVVPAVYGVTVLAEGAIWIQRTLPGERPGLVDVFSPTGEYVHTHRDVALPLGQLPDGRVLIPMRDEQSGGYWIALTAQTHD